MTDTSDPRPFDDVDEPSGAIDLEQLEFEELYAALEQRARDRRESRSCGRRGRGRRAGHVRHDDHGHSHAPAARDNRELSETPAGRVLIAAVAAIAIATVIGLIVLWPSGSSPHVGGEPLGHTVGTSVLSATTRPCVGSGGAQCRFVQIAIHGRHSTVDLGPATTAPAVGAGTEITVSPVTLARGVAVPPGFEPWQFVDVDRHGSLLWLGLAALALSLLVIRWRGLLAGAGVGVSILLVTTFLVPAILDGRPAIPAALVTALATMFVMLVLTNGIGPQMLAAALGISSTLVLTCLVALFAVHLAHIDGRTDELSAYIGTLNSRISLQGIALAGMVIGGLGVLADTAVTQASAVMALRGADPTLTPRGLYSAASRVGRDHLSATIHTLVLAYVGASLPLLLITRASGIGLTDALNTQDIAEPIVATLAGCIGLICAIPLTTGLASLLMARVPAQALADAHGHHHHH